MSSLNRWQQDGAPPEFARLFEAASAERPPPSSVRRALLVVGTAGTASLVASSAAAAGANTASKGLVGVVAKWLALGAISAGTISTVVVVTHQRAAAPTMSAAPSRFEQRTNPQPVGRAQQPRTPGEARATPPAAATSEISQLGVSDELRVTAANPTKPIAHSVARQAREERGSDPDRTLLEEVALVDAARASLRAGNAALALASAEDYSRRFSAGRFAPEISYLAMQAKSQLGQRQAAAEAARELIRRYPNCPQVERARDLLQSVEAEAAP